MPGGSLEAEGKLASLLVRGAKIAICTRIFPTTAALAFEATDRCGQSAQRVSNQVRSYGCFVPEPDDIGKAGDPAKKRRFLPVRAWFGQALWATNLHHLHNREGRLCAV